MLVATMLNGASLVSLKPSDRKTVIVYLLSGITVPSIKPLPTSHENIPLSLIPLAINVPKFGATGQGETVHGGDQLPRKISIVCGAKSAHVPPVAPISHLLL